MLAIATLSRLKRVQAIWLSERPSIAFPEAPSRIAEGSTSAEVPMDSSGVVMKLLSVRTPQRHLAGKD